MSACKLSYKDKKILDALEEFKFLTLRQLGFLFFPHNEHNYHYTRTKMKKLESDGLVKSDTFERLRLYCANEKVEVSYHRMVLLDFYFNLLYCGIKVEDYKLEYKWFNGKFKSDGIFIVEWEGIKSILVCEVDYTHKTDLDKYRVIYESGVCEDKFGERIRQTDTHVDPGSHEINFSAREKI